MFGTRKHMVKPTPSGIVPTTITLSINSYTSNSVTMSWVYVKGTNGQTTPTYTVYKRTNAGAWDSGTSNGTSTTFTATGLSAGNTYDFYVRGSSTDSNTVSYTIPVEGPTLTVPDAPSNLYCSSNTGAIQTIYVFWTLPGSPGGGSNGGAPLLEVEVMQSLDGINWGPASILYPATTTAITATGVTPGDVYFRVRCRNSVGWSSWSNSAAGKSWGYDLQVFSTPGTTTWNKPAGKTVSFANVLIVGGGGSGGAGHGGGGGGGGGVVYVAGHVPSAASLTVTVGGAGNPSGFDGLGAAAGGNGGGVTGGDPYEASRAGSNGGSGGGGSRYDYGYGYAYGAGGSGTSMSSGGLTVYGNSGAPGDDITYTGTPQWSWGGGGGGAGGAGSGSNGGAGLTLLGYLCGQGGNGGLWSPNMTAADAAGAAGGGYGAGGGGGGGGAPTGGIVVVASYY